MSDAALRVRDLRVHYAGADAPAVGGLSFDLPAHGSLAIVGESGSGKTSAVLAMTRLLDGDAEVTAREVSFEGHDLLALDGRGLRQLRRGGLAMVFQDARASWNPARSIEAQLLDGLRGDVRRDARERLVGHMHRIGIADAADRLADHPHNYSGGMLQRAMIAGGLVHDPRLLVADEPTSALDTTVQAELLALLAHLRAERGLSLLLISHDLGVVAKVAEAVLVLYAGRVAEQGSTRDVLQRPQHPYTRDLLASTPTLTGPRKRPLRTGRPGPVSDVGCPYAARCSFAQQRCRVERPVLRRVADVDVACHLAPLPVGAG